MPTLTDASRSSSGGDLLLSPPLHPFQIYVAAVVVVVVPPLHTVLVLFGLERLRSFFGGYFILFFFSFFLLVLERERPGVWRTGVEGFNLPGVALRSQSPSLGLFFFCMFFFLFASLLFPPSALCYCCCESSGDLWLYVFLAESS